MMLKIFDPKIDGWREPRQVDIECLDIARYGYGRVRTAVEECKDFETLFTRLEEIHREVNSMLKELPADE